MPPLAAVAESVLAPAIGSLVGPIVSQIAGPLGNMLGGGISDLIGGFEKSFLGGFGGPQSTPGQGSFPQFPSPFQPPPFVNNPFGPFTGQQGGAGGPGSSTGGFTPADVAKVGGNIDSMEKSAMSVLSDPNASKADIAKAQQTMEMASQMFAMLSKMLEQQSQMATNAIQAIR